MSQTSLVLRHAAPDVSRPALSVCTLASGRTPTRLAATLRLLRPVADEIVVALDDRRSDVAGELGTVADRVLLFQHVEPGDRPMAWLVEQCRGRWVFNLDDDEIPSISLLAELPRLIDDPDVTHCWIARRWLYPDLRRQLAVPPWSTEFQLRLFAADERFVRFTPVFHRPVECIGPTRFVDAPLWHLDTALCSVAERRRKALAYEHARRGMRVNGFSHNTGMYLPEARDDLELAPVPADDAALIARICAAIPTRDETVGVVEPAVPEAVSRCWPGGPFDESMYDAAIELLSPSPRRLVAGTQQAIDVRIHNRGGCVWRAGQVTLAATWADGAEGLRTQLPADVRPGATAVVPVHLVPPAVGDQTVEIDLVHEHVRWFRTPLRHTVDVRPRRRVLVTGDLDEIALVLDELALVPAIEPVVAAALPGHEHPTADDLRAYLFGPEGLSRLRAAVRIASLLLRRRRRRLTAPDLPGCDYVVIAGDGVAGAPPTRERLRLAVFSLLARSAGVPVLHVLTPSLMSAGGPLDRSLDRMRWRVGVRVPLAKLVSSVRDAGGGTRTPTPEGRRF